MCIRDSFHATLSLALSEWVHWAGERSGMWQIALGVGCFLNRLLLTQLRAQLEQSGCQVFSGQQAPPNDGGLSLGQAWVASQISTAEE